MNRRPLSITIVGWVFIVVGSLGLASGLISIARLASVGVTRHQLLDASYVSLSGLIAVIGGAALLHGFRWGRWVCLLWMAAHVVLSLFHSIFEVAIHAVFLLVLIYIFFRAGSTMHSASQT